MKKAEGNKNKLLSISKILVINPYGIGDVLFTTPLIRALKKTYPRAQINVLLGSRTQGVLASNPCVDKIHIFDKGRFDHGSKLKEIPKLIKLIWSLKKEHFDLAVDFSNAPEYGLISKLILKIPRRIGFNYRNRGRFLSHSLKIDGFGQKHIIEYYLDLARALGLDPGDKAPEFYINENDKTWVNDFLAGYKKVKGLQPLVAIIPGGGGSWGKEAAYKHWPAESFARLGDMLAEKFNAQIVLCGDKKESSICRIVFSLMTHKAISVYGRTSLGQLAALLSQCDLVVCNDGGPLHVAVSAGAKTVSMFGPVNEHIYGPYPFDQRHRVVTADINCRPCYKNFKYPSCQDRKCLSQISVKSVFEKASELLNK